MIIKTKSAGYTQYRTPEGEFHNPHGPARKYPNGTISYYQNNRHHNIVGPCYIHNNEIRYRVGGNKIGYSQ